MPSMWSGISKGLAANRAYDLEQRKLAIQEQKDAGRGDDVMDKARLAAERILQQRKAAQLRADTQRDIAEERNKVKREEMGLTSRGQDFDREVGLENVEARLKGLEARAADVALQEKGKTDRNQATINQRDRALNALDAFRAGRLYLDKMRIDDLKELGDEANRIANDRAEDFSRKADADSLYKAAQTELAKRELQGQYDEEAGQRILERFVDSNPAYNIGVQYGVSAKDMESMYRAIAKSPGLITKYIGGALKSTQKGKDSPAYVIPQMEVDTSRGMQPVQGGPLSPAKADIIAPDATAIQTIQDADRGGIAGIPDADEENYTEALTFISRYEAAKQNAERTKTRNPSVESRRGDYEKAKQWIGVYLAKYSDQLKRQSGLKK